MATAPASQQIVLAIIDAATKENLTLVKSNATFKLNDEVIIGDLYRSKDLNTAIVVVHKKVVMEDLDTLVTTPHP